MTFVRSAYQWLAWFAVAMLPLLFLFAGLGTLGGEGIEPHKVLGSAVELVAVLLLVLAVAGTMGRTAIVRAVILVTLVFMEASLASHELNPQWLRSFHVVGAMLVGFALMDTARRAGMPWHRAAVRPEAVPVALGEPASR